VYLFSATCRIVLRGSRFEMVMLPRCDRKRPLMRRACTSVIIMHKKESSHLRVNRSGVGIDSPVPNRKMGHRN